LSSEFFVSVRLEDFSLERQNTNHEAVHALQVEVEVMKCKSLELRISFMINLHEVFVADVSWSISNPDLSEANPGESLLFREDWHLHCNL
jgi:hypothetical protein